MGLARSHGLPEAVENAVDAIQQDLFVLGSQVAASVATKSSRAASLREDRVIELEQEIDQFDAELALMDAFILPGGSVAGAQLHVARTVCRRAERCFVEMSQSIEPDQSMASCIIYLNRLSDLLFVLARYVNHANQTPETKWLPQQ